MTTAAWIIAVCEILRTIEIFINLVLCETAKKKSEEYQRKAFEAYVESLDGLDEMAREEFINGIMEGIVNDTVRD